MRSCARVSDRASGCASQDFGAREVDRNAIFRQLKAGPSEPITRGSLGLPPADPAPAPLGPPTDGQQTHAARVIQDKFRSSKRTSAAAESGGPIWQYDDHPRGWRTYAPSPRRP